MAKILVCDPLHKKALEIMGEGHEVVNHPQIALRELLDTVGDFDAVVVRARTTIDSQVISKGQKLRVIARAGVGTDNIDVEAATQRGILVVNSPDPSISSVAELVFTLLLDVSRHAVAAHSGLKAGKWNKRDLVGRQIEGKTMGIVGLGRIGSKVATIAKGFGLGTLVADPYAPAGFAEKLGAEIVELDELLKRSDFVTLHVPLTDSTRGLIGGEEFALMKRGAVLINTSRAEVVDSEPLVEALEAGRIGGAGLDVFEAQQREKLVTFPTVTLTPHIGASTTEAQSQIAVLIAREVVDSLEGRPTRNPVNMPHIDQKTLAVLQPYLYLTDKMVKILCRFLPGDPRLISLSLLGRASEIDHADYLLRNLVLGVLSSFHEVNVVNAMAAAERMGIRTEISRSTAVDSYLSSIELRVQTPKDLFTIKGALVDSEKARIVGLLGYDLEFVPSGHMLITEHRDVPGMVGTIGTELGLAGINIATMQLARKKMGEQAMMIISTDKDVPDELVEGIRKIKDVTRVETLSL
jgi:D-3-phosphoglycerate dehydrogenase